MPGAAAASLNGATVAAPPRSEWLERVPAAEAGRRGRCRGIAGPWRAPYGGGALGEDRGLGGRWSCVRRVDEPAARHEGTGGPVPTGRAAG